MKNDTDRFSGGFDAGEIQDGIVSLDGETGNYVLVDEDGRIFDIQMALSTLVGKQIRCTIVSLEAMEQMEKMMLKAQDNESN